MGRHIILIIIFALLAFASAVPGDFILDDYIVIVNNRIVASPDRIGSLFNKDAYLSGADKVLFDRGSAEFGAGEATYRPVATFSYMLNHALCGSNPVCFRLTNVLIHAANGVLLYLLLLALFGIPGFSLLSALIFVVHPLSAEVLCCSAFRPNLLALFFSLSSLIFHLRSGKKGKAGALAAAVAGYFLAMFSKETALFLPVAAAFCDFLQGGRRLLFERLRVYAFYAAAAVLFLIVYLFLMPPQQAVMQGPLMVGNNLFRMFDITAFYLKDLFVPVDPLFIFPFQLKHSLPRAVCGAFIYAGLLYALVRFRRMPPPFFFGLLWFFLWLFPMNNFLYAFRVPVAYRYLYLPLAGFAAAAAYPLWLLWSGRAALGNKLRYVLPGAFIAYLLVLAVFSNNNWKNETNLYLSLERKYPGSPFSQLGMGTVLTRYGRFAEAKIKLEKLLRSSWKLHKNDLSVVYRTLSIIYLRLGEYGKAEEMYLKTLEMFPAAGAVWGELGGCYALQGKYDLALESLDRAQELSPGRGTLYFKKGMVYLLKKDVEKAGDQFALLRSSSEGPEDLAETEYYLLLEKAGKSVYNSLSGAESKLLGFIWKGEDL
ncbi:MAG: tetratricopeptide repeat protein [Candidatus Omnitrophica bacterium]|nr:tetratricopeptide repeat protein [Candidatus Omnitrophota bacterium]